MLMKKAQEIKNVSFDWKSEPKRGILKANFSSSSDMSESFQFKIWRVEII